MKIASDAEHNGLQICTPVHRRYPILTTTRPRILPSTCRPALADPKMKARFVDLGVAVLPGSPADFGKLLADETEKWAKVIRAANIKAE